MKILLLFFFQCVSLMLCFCHRRKISGRIQNPAAWFSCDIVTFWSRSPEFFFRLALFQLSRLLEILFSCVDTSSNFTFRYNILVTYHITMQKLNFYLSFNRTFLVQCVPFYVLVIPVETKTPSTENYTYFTEKLILKSG